MRSHRSGADGVVGIAVMFRNAFFRRGSTLDHPVRSVKGGFATSSWCRVHPSCIRRGIASLGFIHTFYDPLFICTWRALLFPCTIPIDEQTTLNPAAITNLDNDRHAILRRRLRHSLPD